MPWLNFHSLDAIFGIEICISVSLFCVVYAGIGSFFGIIPNFSLAAKWPFPA